MQRDDPKGVVIPKHLQIETINGVCSARCPMCTIETWARKPNVMTTDALETILTKFMPYRDRIQYLTLQGLAEPLLDRALPAKVEMAKAMGFTNVGFASNCTHLDEATTSALLNARLDTLICSIDGVKKATHETIRPRTDFDMVVANVERFLCLRDAGRHQTRAVIRLIRQKLNREEWPAYVAYWSERVTPDKGDEIVAFDLHNWSNKIMGYEESNAPGEVPRDGLLCADVFERMVIYSDGRVALCCIDDNGFYDHGNVLTSDPIDLYNGAIFERYRRAMREGNILSLEHCKGCSVPRSRALKAAES